MDLFFTISFSMESLIKSVALGFALERGSYLTESWNQLDFFIIVTSLLGLALSSLNIPALRVLRILRTLSEQLKLLEMRGTGENEVSGRLKKENEEQKKDLKFF